MVARPRTTNARELLGGYEDVRTIGVMRSYMTRHGAGPFVTEDPGFTSASPRPTTAQGMAGLVAGRLDRSEWPSGTPWTPCPTTAELAVTHLDRVQGDWKICHGYDKPLGVPVDIVREKWLMDRAWALRAGLSLLSLSTKGLGRHRSRGVHAGYIEDGTKPGR